MLLLLLACRAAPDGMDASPPPADDPDPGGVTPIDSAPPDTGTPPDDPDPPDDSAPPQDSAPVDTGGAGDTASDPGPPSVTDCFGDLGLVADYAPYAPVMGSHCMGTNHQDIADVERVVFIGDSLTVGSPPTAAADWYRNRLADELAARFGLEAPSWEWENVNLVDGTTYVVESGDFASCAKYGARTDDLLLDPHRQLETCLPEDQRDKRTLVVMTVGGNDLYALLEGVRDGEDLAALEAEWDGALSDLQDAVRWLTEDPKRFPGGLYLVFANLFDVTDATAAADIADCVGAQLIGLDDPLLDPWVAGLATEWQEQALALAVETGTDLVFMGEAFCGHGYNYDDASGRCYRDAEAELWYDFTCMHPNEAGHAALAEMMMAVVEE